MSFAAIATAIRERFHDEVADPNGLVAHYDNSPPGDLSASWYRLSIDQMTADVAEVGTTAPRYRIEGVASVEMHVPSKGGDGALMTIADAITAAFRSVDLSDPDLHFQAPRVGEGTRIDAWFRRVVEIPFWSEVMG